MQMRKEFLDAVRLHCAHTISKAFMIVLLIRFWLFQLGRSLLGCLSLFPYFSPFSAFSPPIFPRTDFLSGREHRAYSRGNGSALPGKLHHGSFLSPPR